MARPRKNGVLHLFRLNQRLWEGEDDDLIAFLNGVPRRKRISALKTALRSGRLAAIVVDDLPDDDDLAAIGLICCGTFPTRIGRRPI